MKTGQKLENTMSRRRFVGGATTGLIGALASNALAQQSQTAANVKPNTVNQTVKQNPARIVIIDILLALKNTLSV